MGIKVMLADGHALFRAGVRKLLEEDGEIEVTAEAGSRQECAARIMEWKGETPQLLFLDIGMSGMEGLAAVEQAKEYMPDMKICALTAHEEPECISKAFELGIDGYLTKDCSPEELRESVHILIGGMKYIQDSLLPLSEGQASHWNEGTWEIEGDEDRERWKSLTARERQVLIQLADGMLNKEIASFLNIREQTVKNYVSSIFRKINVFDRTQAAVYAIRNHLVGLPEDSFGRD